ncbi:sterol uptake control protein 2 [Rhypophila decipiens]
MARLRLGYTKSRGGCLRCKQRRVKCDEDRPCKACTRHGIECSLVTGQSTGTPQPSQSSRSSSTTPSVTTPRQRGKTPDCDFNTLPAARPSHSGQQQLPSISQLIGPHDQLAPYVDTTTISSVSTRSLSLGGTPLPTSPDPYPYFAKFTSYDGEQEPANWASDMELMHHYSTSCYKTIAKGYSPEIWSIEVPKLAFANPYLLHEMLAISAFHLAFLRPDRHEELTVQATHHQSRAIKGIRGVLSNLSAQNCHALFVASTFLFVGSLAASRPTDETVAQDLGLDNLVDVFLLLKGVRGIIDDATNELRSGPLGEIFRPMPMPDRSVGLTRLMVQLQRFLEKLPNLIPTVGDSNGATIKLEVERMIQCIEHAGQTSTSPEYQTLASWPLSLSSGFIGLLRSRNQGALALLSYYCVIMHSTEDSYWFTRGWSVCVMKDIAKVMTSPWNQDCAWAEGWITGQVSVQ